MYAIRSYYVLRQQVGGADLRALAAADAWQRRWRCGHFLAGDGKNAIGGLDDRNGVAADRVSHHRATDQQSLDILRVAAADADQVAERCADANFQVFWRQDSRPCHGHDARQQGLPLADRAVDGCGCADVLADSYTFV